MDYLLKDSLLETEDSAMLISIEVRTKKEKTIIYNTIEGLKKGLKELGN